MTSRAVLDFLQNKLLKQADVTFQADSLRGGGGTLGEAKENPTICELLDRAAAELTPERIHASFPNQPLVQASILHTVGRTYVGVGEYERAVNFLRRSTDLWRQTCGSDYPDTLTSMNDLAMTYSAAGKLNLALPLLEQTLKLQQAKLGPDHFDTLKTINDLAGAYHKAGKLDLALPLLEQTLKLYKAKLGPDHPATLTSMINLAAAYGKAGKLDMALPLLEETPKLLKAKLGPDHPRTVATMNNLAVTYVQLGKLDLALPLLEETLRLRQAELGRDHPDTLESMGNLAVTYAKLGDLDLALPILRETLKLRQAKLGLDHPDTLKSMHDLAVAYRELGRLDVAIPLLEQTLRLQKTKLGRDHPDTLNNMYNVAVAYRDLGKLDLAIPLYEETLKLQKAKLGPDHPDTLTTMNNLAAMYWKLGKLDLAIPLFEAEMKLRKAKLGADHPDTLQSMANLGVNYRDAGRFDEALPLLEEAYQAARKSRLPNCSWFRTELLATYRRAGKSGKAVAMEKELLADEITQSAQRLPGADSKSQASHSKSEGPLPVIGSLIGPDGKWKLPLGDPPPAVAPFDEKKAKNHQEGWAKHLSLPVEIANSIGMKLVLIPPGEFKMGEGAGAHDVRITRPFYLGRYKVTQEEWVAVMRINPSAFSATGKRKGEAAGQDTKRLPVESVSWFDAVRFCRRLSSRPEEKTAGRSYCLPSEAQWEHACRAGSTSRWCYGDNGSELDDYAWYEDNSGDRPHAVGGKKPKCLGTLRHARERFRVVRRLVWRRSQSASRERPDRSSPRARRASYAVGAFTARRLTASLPERWVSHPRSAAKTWAFASC